MIILIYSERLNFLLNFFIRNAMAIFKLHNYEKCQISCFSLDMAMYFSY